MPVEGIHLHQVFTLRTIDDMKAIRQFIKVNECQKAAVIGGGFIGFEAAENLQCLGLQATVIEQLPHVFAPMDADIAQAIHDELQRHNVKLLLGSKVTRIHQNDKKHLETVSKVAVDTTNGGSVHVDFVVLCVGAQPRTSLAAAVGLELGTKGVTINEYMQISDPDIYAVGDMVETMNIVSLDTTVMAHAGPASRQGRCAANHMLGQSHRYRGSIGTWVCKVFDLTIASTGLSVTELQRLGSPVQWITIHPYDHASYYPGAAPMTLRVTFTPDQGQLLGAQIVGKSGVDKRIDVLSTAILACMRVHDLEHLELAYAPPYSSAKDPVNMAGFVGSNVVRGDVKIMHARDVAGLLDTHQVVDVRNPAEHLHGHLPGAMNYPLTELRQKHHHLDFDRGILVYCQDGYRGYLAYRILTQLGFMVANLDGGYESYRAHRGND